MSRRFLPLVLFAAALAACGPVVQEAEPDDDSAHASRLPANGRAQGTISRPDDVDWYKVAVDRDSGVLSLHVGGIRDVDFVLSFRDKTGAELKRIDETGVGGDEVATDLGVSRGDWYVVLSNKNPKADNPSQKYVLTAKLESATGREQEPNDTPLTANTLELNGVTRGHYYPNTNLLSDDPDKAEQDWFRVKVDRAGVYALNLDLSGVPNVDPVLEVYDVNSYKLKEVSAGGAGLGLTLKDFGVRAPAQYLLRLRTRGPRMGNPDSLYELLSELRPYDGRTELEPNDQRNDATPFERDSIAGHIAPAGDVDWYRVSADVSTRTILRADLSAVPGLDLILTVTDDIGQPLLVIDNGIRETPEVLTGLGMSNATYYLVVTEKSGKAADPRNAYTLTKTLAPWQPGLEWEPNDSTGTAQALKIGESVDGYLAPKGDVDFYMFNVYQKGDIVCDLTGVINVRWSAELYDQDNKQILAQIAAKTGEPLSFDRELEPGTYWLKLKGTDPNQNNVRDKYTLRLKAR
ncbi:MAG: hypothetical protein NTY77_18385 [Elusimicrobia bacterium]|nr:hypothetical protein [Elusimicrobiota bacterium]